MKREHDGIARVDGELCSALVDSELAAGECQSAMAELRSAPLAMQRWAIYHAVGDALRSPEVAACHSPRFTQAMHERLAAEPVVIVPARRNRVWLPALGIAAAVAALAWAVLPMMARPGGAEPVSLALAPRGSGVVVAASEPGLRSYLNAHLELAGGTAFAAPIEVAAAGLDLGDDL